MRRVSIPFVVAIAICSCAPPASDDAGGAVPAEPPLAAPPRTESISGQTLLGDWELHRRPRSATGMRLALRVDSASGLRFRSSVTFLMFGNAGTPAEAFAPAWGEVSPPRDVTIPIRTRDLRPVGIVRGTVLGDTIVVRELLWESERQTRDGLQLRLVRTPARPRSGM